MIPIYFLLFLLHFWVTLAELMCSCVSNIDLPSSFENMFLISKEVFTSSFILVIAKGNPDSDREKIRLYIITLLLLSFYPAEGTPHRSIIS
jgi:hypothetical protein